MEEKENEENIKIDFEKIKSEEEEKKKIILRNQK